MPSPQMSLDLPRPDGISPKVQAAIERLARHSEAGARGAIFTRQEVVEFILDILGYTADRPLHTKRLLEPSFGGGDFLLPVIERLLRAWRAARPQSGAVAALGDAIRGVNGVRFN